MKIQVPTQGIPVQTQFQEYQRAPEGLESAFGIGIAESEARLGRDFNQLHRQMEEIQAVNNETRVADSYANEFAPKLRAITQEYSALQGKNAVDQYPEYEKKIMGLRDETRKSLGNPMQQKQFDAIARRSQENELNSMMRHSVQQNKLYEAQTSDAMLNSIRMNAGDKFNDPAALGAALFNSSQEVHRYAENAGQSPEERKYRQQQQWDGIFGENLQTAIAAQDYAAADTLLKTATGGLMLPGGEVAKMSAAASVQFARHLNAHLDANKINTATDQILNYQSTTGQSSSTKSVPYNAGNVKSKDGGWVNPLTPQDGVNVMVSNLRGKQYSGLTLNEIGAKWVIGKQQAELSPSEMQAVSDWVRNVSRSSGSLQPGQVPDLDDAQTINTIAAAIVTAEKSRGDASLFTPSIIAAGVKDALSGKKPQIAGKNQTIQSRSVPDAKSIQENWQDNINKASEWAEQQHPGNAEFKHKAIADVTAKMHMTVSAENAMDTQRQRSVVAAISTGISTMPQLYATPAGKDAVDLVSKGKLAQSTLDAMLAHNAKGEDVPRSAATEDLRMQYLGKAGTNPEGFMAEDLMPLYTKMPYSDYKQLTEQQFAMRKDTAKKDVSAESKQVNLLNALSTLQSTGVLEQGGLIYNHKQGATQAKEMDQYTGRLGIALVDFKEKNGRVPNQMEERSIGSALLTKVRKPGWAGYVTKDVPGTLLTPEQEAKGIVQLKPEDRAKYISGFVSMFGVSPSEEQIQMVAKADKFHRGDKDAAINLYNTLKNSIQKVK